MLGMWIHSLDEAESAVHSFMISEIEAWMLGFGIIPADRVRAEHQHVAKASPDSIAFS